MHDQSLDRVNGRSMAAFATICERKLNMVSVLKSAGDLLASSLMAAVCAEV
jgi:hypothetical protein